MSQSTQKPEQGIELLEKQYEMLSLFFERNFFFKKNSLNYVENIPSHLENVFDQILSGSEEFDYENNYESAHK